MSNMVVHIFDVEHGACNIIETPNNQIIMIDCGHNSTTGWRPSRWISEKGLTITNLAISNIDEDHLSDLANIDQICRPQTLTTNFDLVPDWIERKKKTTGGVGQGVQKLLEYLGQVFTGKHIDIDYGLERRLFYHSTSKFDDFNNLSLVSFIKFAGVTIVLPGDIEKQGWTEFLKDSEFRSWLLKTNIFVASHHGRIGGYCKEVFDFCSPSFVIISDKGIEHGTQEHDEYSKHASGIWFGKNQRKVLTTRKYGKIKIEITPEGKFTVYTES